MSEVEAEIPAFIEVVVTSDIKITIPRSLFEAMQPHASNITLVNRVGFGAGPIAMDPKLVETLCVYFAGKGAEWATKKIATAMREAQPKKSKLVTL